MSTLTVTFVQADGVERVLKNAKSGQTLMEVGPRWSEGNRCDVWRIRRRIVDTRTIVGHPHRF
jgi:hypothetical protein